MAASSFDAAIARVFAHEGGYSNHPSDPGRPTKFGITLATYRQYVKANATAEDLRAMTVTQAKAIYRARYWDALRCDELPAGVDYAVFDYGVNSGIARSGKVLRRLLALSDTSSAVTADVMRAAQKADARALIAALCDERLAFLQSLKTWPVFGAGWGRRVAEVKRDALAMAVAKPVTSAVQKGAAGAVILGGSLAAAKAHAAEAAHVFVILIVVATLLAAGVLLWRRKQTQEA
jgi:lysozyme family protein